MEENFKLDKFQEEAIRLAQEGNSVIVNAPTGSGKTLIAERIIEDCIAKGKGVIYTAPIKALSNQKYRDFSKKYQDLVGIVTGDITLNRDAPILIMTTEIFRNAILTDPEDFKWREWIIFDEIHYMDDVERGTVWEEAIILLPQHMKMLALSATIPNLNEFVAWIEKIHGSKIKIIIEENRPVPLHFLFQCNNEFFANFDELAQSRLVHKQITHLAKKEKYHPVKPNRLHTLMSHLEKKDAYSCIYFCFSRRRCEDLAQEAGQFDLLNAQEKQKITILFEKLLAKFNLSSQHIFFLEPIIKRGIAYHHAGLLPTLKEIIEQLFTSGLIKMIFTTETFALGVNMPARTVVFDSMSKFYGRSHAYLRTRDFFQMAGRAGRRGIDTEGFVLSRINPQRIEMPALENIIYGDYEPISSQLNSCYATILNLYRVMGEKILDIYPNSFHFFQSSSKQNQDALVMFQRKLSLLKKMGYISEGKITSKAELAAQIYSFELPMGEIFEQGFFDTLDEETLFITITALVYEPRKGEERPRLNKRIKRLRNALLNFTRSIQHKEKSFHVSPYSKSFFFHLNEACKAWFHGASFDKISRTCRIDEGEIVRYFRMSIQVLREMYCSKAIDPEFKKHILNCIKRVNRDVVDAEKQLRQEF